MAQENEDGQEKSEEPTGKRLQDAKQKGEVPRSKELNTTLVLMAGAIGLLVMGRGIGDGLAGIMKSSLNIDRQVIFEPMLMLQSAINILLDAFILISPLIGLLVLSVFISPLVVGGFTFSTKKIQPKLTNMSPLKGMKKLFGFQGLMELVKSILKVLLVGGLSAILIIEMFDDVLRISRYEFTTAFGQSTQMVGWYFLAVCSTIIIIAAIDVPFQIWQHKKQQRMTKKEVKEERKSTEGSAEVKGKIRQLQMEAAMRRMMEEVPKADVIITNPTHFAVALKYEDSKMGAPKLVAKGTELTAARIREIAAEHNIPMVSAPPLARAIYFSTDIEQEIPARLYLAVAQILAYIYQLKQATSYGVEPPQMPTDLDVPDDMWKDKQ
jgi:flagellar biosynthetic protein FlhB